LSAKRPPEPEPATITADRLAEITGLTDRRHRQLADAGYIPHPKRGVYHMEKALAGFIRYLSEKAKKAGGDIKAEQLLLTKARRESTEHELAISRREYIPRADVGPWLRNIGLHQRALLLRKYEQELAPKLDGKNTVEILDLIRGVNDEVIEAYRTGVAQWVTEPPK